MQNSYYGLTLCEVFYLIFILFRFFIGNELICDVFELLDERQENSGSHNTKNAVDNGYLPINVKFTDRKRYYEAFDAYYRDNDATKMISIIAEYVNERLDEYLKILGE